MLHYILTAIMHCLLCRVIVVLVFGGAGGGSGYCGLAG